MKTLTQGLNRLLRDRRRHSQAPTLGERELEVMKITPARKRRFEPRPPLWMRELGYDGSDTKVKSEQIQVLTSTNVLTSNMF